MWIKQLCNIEGTLYDDMLSLLLAQNMLNNLGEDMVVTQSQEYVHVDPVIFNFNFHFKLPKLQVSSKFQAAWWHGCNWIYVHCSFTVI